ncbi:hypothetical protein FGO68_gene1979 [Halteria grandinella]|uniref:Uncharacterized protein n=1 Tax=Halteria grandinella TaxID=5974 RepID=A0A8J8SYA7_HALGN|nr:hypothetical protein FGO68_gene1979 [Halteria grandinella]
MSAQPEQQQPISLEELSGHSLMLIQFVSNEESRTFLDARSPYDLMELLVRMFENYFLQKRQATTAPGSSNTVNADYELKDICDFIDQLYDLSMMVFNQKAAGYTSHGKTWIKGMVHVYLRRLSIGSGSEQQIKEAQPHQQAVQQ